MNSGSRAWSSTITGQAASRTILSISSRACSELSPSPTSATSGRSLAVAGPTSSTSISRAITSWPSPTTIGATSARRSLRSLAIRTRRCLVSRELITVQPSGPPDSSGRIDVRSPQISAGSDFRLRHSAGVLVSTWTVERRGAFCQEPVMIAYIVLAIVLVALAGLAMSVRILKQYERAVMFHLGKVRDGARGPGLIFFAPLINQVHRVSLRIITMPIQSQGIITSDNVSIDVSAVAYYRVDDPIRSVVAIENVEVAINQIAQTTLRAVVGRHTLDETLSETDTINKNIREILDVQTEEWGIKVTTVELKDIQLPDSMKRAMARQAEAEREKRAKIIAAEGEALAAGELAHASDVMMEHPLALQLRNLQTLVEIAVDKNSTVVFPAPLMSTIQELGTFLRRETDAASELPAPALTTA